jgi:hypothetical protein
MEGEELMNLGRGIAALTAIVFVIGTAGTTVGQTERPSLPEEVTGPVGDTSTSHAFLASAYLMQPIDLGRYGYVEEEFLVSGQARVFDWPAKDDLRVLAQGPYTTRILVRRPKDRQKFNGTAIVEPLNPTTPVDLPIMWAESHEQLMADGYVWVGITIKPNTIKSLKAFDRQRYAALSMPRPLSEPSCSESDISLWAQPTTPADETGLAWDMLSQIGALLKSHSRENPLPWPAARLYMTGQSQTAGYSRTYASVFGRREAGPDGKPLYDGYLHSGSQDFLIPLHQCAKSFPRGDPRVITAAAGVPIIEMFAEGDMGGNVVTRRPDSDTAPDLFRRYENAGAEHDDPYSEPSYASTADLVRATGQANPYGELSGCEPIGVLSDFPVHYIFDAAWRMLDNWVRNGVAPPHGAPLELKPGEHGTPLKAPYDEHGAPVATTGDSPFVPDQAFVVDEYGNAKGGVRTPYVDVPAARYVGAKRGSIGCFLDGAKYPFSKAKLKSIYGDHAGYVAKVRASASALEAQHWLTPADSAAIVKEAERAQIP